MVLDVLRYIKHDIFEYYYYLYKNESIRKKSPKVEVRSIEETIRYIIDNKASMSRFGDGEFLWMIDGNQNSFQEQSEELKERLLEIVKSDIPNHIVCLSDAFGKLNQYNHFCNRFWARFMVIYRKRWTELLKPGKVYYNTNTTRLYMDYKDKSNCKKNFELMKKIWEGRDIVIVEGRYSRLGVGNDLFDKAKGIQRILGPERNAFSYYDELLNAVQNKVGKDKLVLIALGPTATVLAYDLAKLGYQALDVGHIDIEYEWMNMGATEKVPIPSKYVNEAAHGSGRINTNISDEKYLSEIIETIG